MTPLFGVEQAKRSFEVPAGDAATTLREFALQASEQVAFPADMVRGVQTNAVKGEFTPREALDRMTAGTELVVVEDQQTGALTVRRKILPNAQRAALVVVESARPGNDFVGNDQTVNLEEMVVTGTQIHGIGAGSEISPVLTVSHEQLERSGYTTMSEFIDSLPQNFAAGGGVLALGQDGVLGTGSTANTVSASVVDLHGLGPSSTLTLLNGHRMAPAIFGGVTDISVIPLAVIDRIEIVEDGSSAIYGSDAVGGVVNFVLRKDYQGSESYAKYGSVTKGSLEQELVGQDIGVKWKNGDMLLNLQYEHQTPLQTSDRSFTATVPVPTNILPEYKKYSGLLSLHQNLTSRIQFFVDVLATQNNLDRKETLTYEFEEDKVRNVSSNLQAGFEVNLFGDWRAELTDTYGNETMRLSYPSISPGRPNAKYIPGTPASYTLASISDGELKVDGTLFSYAGRDVRGAFGGSYLNEHATADSTWSPTPWRRFDRFVRSGFAEVYLPLLVEENKSAFVKSLALSGAVRSDDYSDFGATKNTKIGFNLELPQGWAIHASRGTSFRAPTPDDLLDSGLPQSAIIYPFNSPSGGTVPVIVIAGAPPRLLPETATTWTSGVDYHPKGVTGLKLSVNYYNIDYRNRIIAPPLNTNALFTPAVYGSLITPLNSDVDAAAYLANLVAHGAVVYDLLGKGTTGVRNVFDAATLNAAIWNTTGEDVDGRYVFNYAENRLEVGINLALVNHIERQFSTGAITNEILNTYQNPLRLRWRSDLSWSRLGWSVNGAVNFNNAYKDTSANPVGSIPTWTTCDLTARYDFGKVNGNGYLNGLSVGLNVINVFNALPPYVNGGGISIVGVHYDQANADPRGRLISFEVRKRW